MITLLEWHNRRERVTTTGMEIRAEVHVEPYAARSIVISALLGGVTGNTKDDTRVLPVPDHDYPFCYCVEAAGRRWSPRRWRQGRALNFTRGASDWNETRLLLTRAMDGAGCCVDANVSPGDRRQRYSFPAIIEAVFRPLSTAPTTGCRVRRNSRLISSIRSSRHAFGRCPRTKGYTFARRRPMLSGLDSLSALRRNTRRTPGRNSLSAVSCVLAFPTRPLPPCVNTINHFAWAPGNMTLPGLPGGVFPERTLRSMTAVK